MMYTLLDKNFSGRKVRYLSSLLTRVSLLEVSMFKVTYDHYEQGQHREIMPANPQVTAVVRQWKVMMTLESNEKF